ncbi:HTH-like domain-containing protein [Thomasclavelia cocleata]|uniref:HTH-like domain-containing protein n=1 Tax=Thomasclavelia cocleata TaxID=69824 RepID=UPI00248C98F1|nr:hypothetical protein [Thomasclavelia cocleata]
MPYTYKQAIATVYEYLEVNKDEIEVIEDTNDRGFVCNFDGEKCVIFVYPISCKKNNKQNFFDTRDSGFDERKITWKYACENGLKYFCLGVNSEQDRYKEYVFSLESPEEQISNVSFRKSNSSSGTGTQINIPADFIPNKSFERIRTPLGFYISAIKKEFIRNYLNDFDNRPYYNNSSRYENLNELLFLKEKLEEYYKKYGSSGVHLFGFDFYEYFNKQKFNINDIIKESSLKDTQYVTEIRKGINLRKIVLERPNIKSDSLSKLSESRTKDGFNKIYYGIPGCGKSYLVEKEIRDNMKDENDKLDKQKYKNNVFRTTFYLDYSNSDFVGQLLPRTDKNGKIMYELIPGPFTKALERAYNTDDMVYLIIEEINRGNAAAIFGDIFQLLDRLDEEKIKIRNDMDDGGWKIGDSEYPINNIFIQDYLGIEEGSVIIPSNLTIYATMNTSDQNVFPLDTAFKRRWQMERIVNDWNNHKFKDYYIPFTNITWKKFVNVVNNEILKTSNDGIMLEDKQIGAYFANKDMLAENENNRDEEKLKMFINKVVDYLYNDVFKFNRGELFKDIKNFNELCEIVEEYGEKIDFVSNNLCLNINFDNYTDDGNIDNEI